MAAESRSRQERASYPKKATELGGRRFHIPLIVIILLYLIISFLTFNQIAEDAFIYFRLAANIAGGHGYVFNLGGEHIESGSGLLWQLLLAAAWFFPLHMIVKAKLLGIALGCLALWLTYRITRRLVSDSVLQWIPALLLAFSIPFFCWSQRGLETSFYLSALLLLCDVCCDERTRRHWYLPAMLLSCSRPEGFLMLVALLPFFVLYRKELTGAWRGAAILFGLLAMLTLFRLWYFHDIFPHPFYLKANTSFGAGVLRIKGYVTDNGLLFLVVPAALAYLHPRSWSRQKAVVVSFLVVTAGWASIAAEGMAPYFRHMTAMLPFLFLTAVAGLEALARGRARLWSVRAACIAFALAMLMFSQSSYTRQRPNPSVFAHAARIALQDPVAYADRVRQILTNPDEFFADLPARPVPQIENSQLLRDPINTNYQATSGRFIRMNYPTGITIVYDQMGQTPWYAGGDKRFIDSWGLLNRRIGYRQFQLRSQSNPILRRYEEAVFWLTGRLWPHEQRRFGATDSLAFIFGQRPELIVINDVAAWIPHSVPGRLNRDPRLRNRYTPAYLVNHVMRIYERNDIYSQSRSHVPRGCYVKNLRAAVAPDTLSEPDHQGTRVEAADRGTKGSRR